MYLLGFDYDQNVLCPPYVDKSKMCISAAYLPIVRHISDVYSPWKWDIKTPYVPRMPASLTGAAAGQLRTIKLNYWQGTVGK